MKIYTELIDLSNDIRQTFFVSPFSDYKMGVKVVQDVGFKVMDGENELSPENELIDGYTIYSLKSTTPGRKTYKVVCDNGQSIQIVEVTQKSTVYDVSANNADSGKLISEDGNQYINGAGEVYVKGGKSYSPWVASYVEGGSVIDEMTFVHMGPMDGGHWIAYYRGVSVNTEPMNIVGDGNALELNFRWNDDGQWFDVVATRTEVESEWTKSGDLALQGDITEIDSKATNALNLANNLSSRVDEIDTQIEGISTTKADVTETERLSNDLTQAFDYIAELQQDKITSPMEQMEVGKVLTVVEVQDTPSQASTFSQSRQGTGTHLEWQAVEPQKVTKTSELVNDSGFVVESEVQGLRTEITQVTEIANTAQSNVNALQTNVQQNTTTLGQKADKTQLPTKTSQLENDSGYTTQSYVDNAIGHVLTQETF